MLQAFFVKIVSGEEADDAKAVLTTLIFALDNEADGVATNACVSARSGSNEEDEEV